ncbi:MerR family transcriptional regulator [Nocardia cyriacigeorgica]|uniref:MerR family transcriptional regulator n=1 Tax=Nocardia cyriacigeorgica TaxID=135487 RepID=A0A6P1D869_9NOCA|nr:MerR family transcriptional regulator [Nocardia cyriacigeorgica]NEW38161.1 MerR family transcriptional regulator [Nocardia cyriacigeorgica]NEW45819.1 MerR family transcriptional regulator [Nocardia cyriacigeorgica]NEW48456.1 MerR family transcriptional regulator [Nocardia cyriacigeorgica]NEW57556.1 MerR family transcriptional regulator [Nocardia cyriacigeorgica]
MTDTLVRIGELATRAGVSNRTIDYYTSLGLLTPAERTAGGYRLYHPGDVDRIHLIQRLEAQGIPLEEIASALNARPGDTGKALAQIDGDLKNLQTAAETAPAEIQGLLNIIAARVHSLVSVALQIPPDLPIL